MTNKRSETDSKAEEERAARRARNAENRARREANAAKREARKAAARKRPTGKSAVAGSSDAGKGKTKKKGPVAKPAALKQNPAAGGRAGSARASGPANAPKQIIAHEAQDYSAQPGHFNILLVVQAGKLEAEAALFVESLRQNAPDWRGRLILAEPRPDGAWAGQHVHISPQARAIFEARGAEILPFTARHFGANYPYGNKIEALSVLPAGENFIFFDSDTLVTGPLDQVAFDFAHPAASMRREGTWPKPPLYGPGYADIWRSLYDRFGLSFEDTLDLAQPDEHWERYLYFNAGWFFGADPAAFGERFLDWSRAILDDPGDELACQEFYPWLDQITLPLVIHSLGGGRPGPELGGLDGDITCHWRRLPLLYAREDDRVVDVLERAAFTPDIQELISTWEPAQRLIYQGHGRDALRPVIDRERLPFHEQPLRQQIKRAGWWLA